MPKEVPSEAPVKPAARRSLFNKPAWSDAQKTSGDAVDLFSRSKQRYTDIVKEQDDRRKRKKRRLARQRGGSAVDEDGQGGREEKRRRLEDVSEDDDDGSSGSGSDNDDEDEAEVVARRKAYIIALEDSDDDNSRPPPPPPDVREESPKPTSRRHEDVVGVKTSGHTHVQKAVPGAPIEISDNEDADELVQIQTKQRQDNDDELTITDSIQRPIQDQDPVSDEEYPELARLARERARSRQHQPTASSYEAPSGPPALSSHGMPDIHLPTPPPQPDAIVSILIQSRIANTNPLIVQRKLSQPLKDVRLAWCTRQNFDQETTDSVFLTWRGKRLFDVTTCKSLGIGVDEDGNVVTRADYKDFIGEGNNQINMEAMTQEILDEVRKAREEMNAAGSSFHDTQQTQPDQNTNNNNTVDENTAAASLQQPKEQQIRVILKSKGHEDFKLIIKPTTKISRMQSAFRQARKIEPARDVFLMFDGDKLNPEDMAADTDISDMDHIDVHVK